ncbi:MAG: tetratricopeptide repeat protein, partial [Candidatus Omnitrophica bacterium]|nr:tetratricopeptide repeat protein [Candidatus Omnitrophota bacterium]
PYHLASVIIHTLNTILIFFFLVLFFKPETSFLGAGLFAVHPIHTEAVTWISGKIYLIIALYVLAVYLLYNRAMRSEKKINWRYALSILLFSYSVISLNFLSFCFLIPFFLIFSDLTFGEWRKNWKYWLPFLAVIIIRLVLAKSQIAGRITNLAIEAGDKGNLSNPVYNMTYSLFFNGGLILWPIKLTLYHEPAVISSFALRVELMIISLVILSLPLIYKKAKVLFFALGLFVLFLVPAYSPLRISWLVAERYVYFSSVALSMLVCFLYEKYVGTSKINLKKRKLALSLLIILAGIYLVRTVIRNEDWKTPERFWRSTLAVSFKSPRAHNNMGDIYSQEGNVAGALQEFKQAVELWPNYADGYHNLANTYHRSGNISEATKYYRLALQFNPRLFESRFNLGVIYLEAGQLDLAIEQFTKAIEIRPWEKSVYDALAIAKSRKEAGG